MLGQFWSQSQPFNSDAMDWTCLGCSAGLCDWQPPRTVPRPQPKCGWTSPCGFYSDCRKHLKTTTRERTWKKKKKKGLFLTGPRGTWEVLREQVWTWVLPLLRLAVVGPTVLRLHFYWWILNIRAGIKAQEWKSRQVVSRLSHWALSKKRSCTGGVAWSLCGYVFGNVLCGDSILPSGCLAIKKLNVRLSEYNKKNNNCQEFTL